jgi:3-hydroxypropanoate dehydrogenase
MSDVSNSVSDAVLAKIFVEARTLRSWTTASVDEILLRRLYELTALGPTANNSCPLRVVFVVSQEGKEKLRPALNPTNVDKTMSAPVTAILAFDAEWWKELPNLGASVESRSQILSQGVERLIPNGRNNTWLEAGYFILAARSLGLDAGPMIGFDPARVDEAFLSEMTWKSQLLVNLGYGDRSSLRPRAPRLDFATGARLV